MYRDNFLEEKLREFHQKVNSVASSEGVWTKEQMPKETIQEEKQEKIDKFFELNKLKEVKLNYKNNLKTKNSYKCNKKI